MKVQISCSGFFVALLTILFIGLKLTGYVEWSWIWVLSPMWITAACSILLLFALFLFVLFVQEA